MGGLATTSKWQTSACEPNISFLMPKILRIGKGSQCPIKQSSSSRSCWAPYFFPAPPAFDPLPAFATAPPPFADFPAFAPPFPPSPFAAPVPPAPVATAALFSRSSFSFRATLSTDQNCQSSVVSWQAKFFSGTLGYRPLHLVHVVFALGHVRLACRYATS